MVREQACDFHFSDDRGTLTQLVHEGWQQINVITSKKDSVRGGHYHRENAEAFYIVSGALEVIVNGASFHFRENAFFTIDAGDRHSFHFLENTVLVSMYSSGVELPDGTKDIFSD